MLTLTTRAAVEAAVADASLDPDLRRLLAVRARQLEEDAGSDFDLGELAHFHAVEPGDDLGAVGAALGFGDPDLIPPWEWIEDHGGYHEAVFVVSDDGFGHVLFVPKHAGINPRLLALCSEHLAPA